MLTAALLLAAAVGVPGAEAQEEGRTGGAGGLRRLSASCKAEAARFCQAPAASAPTPREQLICLRPYRSSLSLPCRAAVNAMSGR